MLCGSGHFLYMYVDLRANHSIHVKSQARSDTPVASVLRGWRQEDVGCLPSSMFTESLIDCGAQMPTRVTYCRAAWWRTFSK